MRSPGWKPRAGLAILLPLALFLLAAAPARQENSADALIRQANAAFLRGERDEADRLYTAAEERTTDPGLVAFNRAAVLFQKGDLRDFREAEVLYARVLDDAACPPERAAKSWYNRGTCLVRRGGSAGVYRSAIVCLEHCLDFDAADEPLKADARYNLELAKTLWNEARKKDSTPDKPNDNPPMDDPQNDPPPPKDSGIEPNSGMAEDGDSKGGQKTTRPITQPNTSPNPATTPNASQTPNTGATPAPSLENDRKVQHLSPEDTRKHLRDTAARLKKDQHDLLGALYGQPQPGLRDW